MSVNIQYISFVEDENEKFRVLKRLSIENSHIILYFMATDLAFESPDPTLSKWFRNLMYFMVNPLERLSQNSVFLTESEFEKFIIDFVDSIHYVKINDPQCFWRPFTNGIFLFLTIHGQKSHKGVKTLERENLQICSVGRNGMMLMNKIF